MYMYVYMRGRGGMSAHPVDSIWGFDYIFANYNFNKKFESQKSPRISPLWQGIC